VGLAPGQVRELVIGRSADDLDVAIREIAYFLAELDELRRTDEGEILWLEKEECPLSWKRLVADLGDVVAGDAIAGFAAELRECVVNSEHGNDGWLDGLRASRQRNSPLPRQNSNRVPPACHCACDERWGRQAQRRGFALTCSKSTTSTVIERADF
jgi:hypothetical protein